MVSDDGPASLDEGQMGRGGSGRAIRTRREGDKSPQRTRREVIAIRLRLTKLLALA